MTLIFNLKYVGWALALPLRVNFKLTFRVRLRPLTGVSRSQLEVSLQ